MCWHFVRRWILNKVLKNGVVCKAQIIKYFKVLPSVNRIFEYFAGRIYNHQFLYSYWYFDWLQHKIINFETPLWLGKTSIIWRTSEYIFKKKYIIEWKKLFLAILKTANNLLMRLKFFIRVYANFIYWHNIQCYISKKWVITLSSLSFSPGGKHTLLNIGLPRYFHFYLLCIVTIQLVWILFRSSVNLVRARPQIRLWRTRADKGSNMGDMNCK